MAAIFLTLFCYMTTSFESELHKMKSWMSPGSSWTVHMCWNCIFGLKSLFSSAKIELNFWHFSTLFCFCRQRSGGATSSCFLQIFHLVKVAFLVQSLMQSITIKFHYHGWIPHGKIEILIYVLLLKLLQAYENEIGLRLHLKVALL